MLIHTNNLSATRPSFQFGRRLASRLQGTQLFILGKRTLLLGWVLATALLAASTASAQITIDTVLVGDPGNAADTTGYGAVDYQYHIGTYEVTNAQYAAFLNSVDPAGTNPNGIYNPEMGSDARGGISFNPLAAAGSKYATKPNMANKPVNFVSNWDAARFANWLTNGQGAGSTETGIYELTTEGIDGNTITRNDEAWLAGGMAIASENEWYKAAYYDGNGGYWDYPTQSDTAPTAAVPPGGANSANFFGGPGTMTDVGAYTSSASYYGTFDQGGNVFEWSDTNLGVARVARGSSLASTSSFLQSTDKLSLVPTNELSDVGFRVSSLTAIVDEDPPAVVSIERLDPMSATATPVGGTGGSVTFRVTFSEDVQNVDAGDFAVTGDATTGGVTDVSPVSASVYEVTVGNITTTGTVGLSVLAAQGPG